MQHNAAGHSEHALMNRNVHMQAAVTYTETQRLPLHRLLPKGLLRSNRIAAICKILLYEQAWIITFKWPLQSRLVEKLHSSNSL